MLLGIPQDVYDDHATPGVQATARFAAGTAPKETQVADIADTKRIGLWRVSVWNLSGDVQQRVLAQILYGASSSMRVIDLVLPLVAYVPGNVGIYVLPDTAGAPLATAIQVGVTVARVGGEGLPQILRSVADATAGAVQLPPSGVRYHALSASTLTIEGVAGIVVAPLATVLLSSPAVLTAGVGFVEHAL